MRAHIRIEYEIWDGSPESTEAVKKLTGFQTENVGGTILVAWADDPNHDGIRAVYGDAIVKLPNGEITVFDSESDVVADLEMRASRGLHRLIPNSIEGTCQR